MADKLSPNMTADVLAAIYSAIPKFIEEIEMSALIVAICGSHYWEKETATSVIANALITQLRYCGMSNARIAKSLQSLAYEIDCGSLSDPNANRHYN